jgi:Fur family ferric uptake transcriptional regulator
MSINTKKLQRKSERTATAGAFAVFRSYLADHRLRLTAQRRRILEEIFEQDGHFDAEEFYEMFRAAGSDVSRATVYRTLGHLCGSGLLREVLRLHGRAHYEHVHGHEHHDHMVCVRCGKVIEFSDRRIEQLQDRVCRRQGFTPLEHRMSIGGICGACRRSRTDEEE